MKRSDDLRALLTPWAGLVGGVLGGALAHQFGADGTFDHCGAISPGPLIIVALIGLALAVFGGIASLGVARDPAATPASRVVAVVSSGMAALFAVAILLPVIASLILPPCFG